MREISYNAATKMENRFPKIRKLGALGPNGEASAFVWHGELMRFENEDPSRIYSKDVTIRAVVRKWSGEVISRFGGACQFYSFFADGYVAYVLGTSRTADDTILISESRDLVNWSEPRVLLCNPGWRYCNTCLVKGADGYVLLLEADGRNVSEEIAKQVGVGYTFFFATSKDLVHWENMDPSRCYHPGRYNGGPWMTYCNGWYYVISVTELPGKIYTNYLSRTRDFETWYLGKYNPFLISGNEDRLISPNAVDMTPQLLEEIRTGYICDNSDIDMCEFEGKTHIVYGPGNQLGFYFMAEAVYDGPMQELLENFFE